VTAVFNKRIVRFLGSKSFITHFSYLTTHLDIFVHVDQKQESPTGVAESRSCAFRFPTLHVLQVRHALSMFRVSLGFFLHGDGSSIIVWEPQPEHSRRKINPNLVPRGQQHFPSQSILAVVPLFGQCLISRVTATTNILCTVTLFGRRDNVLAGVAARGRSHAIVVPC
jgi:hypothetical protein